jgi:serine/threonine protein kinase/tetratricopeptide (TPR) repeat protein
MVGRTLAHYQIHEMLGAGGMGVVYRAHDTQLHRFVALKVVAEGEHVSENSRQRLLREGRAAAALNHPHICTVYEVGEAEGQTYIAMELVEGRTLGALIGTGGLPVETVIRYGAQIADALAHAHERGVVHRDLKSANVIVTPEGRAKVLDFGLAKRGAVDNASAENDDTATQEGTIAGTFAYMAPEVLRGEPADPRSDLWALGVMLHEAVSGRLPFRGATNFETSSAILKEPPPPLPAGVSPGLAAIIQRLLAKPSGERYQRAGEVRAALEAIQPSVSASGPMPAVAPSRRKWLWPAAAAAAIVIAAGVWFGIQRLRPSAAVKSAGPRLSDGSRPSAIREANVYYEQGMKFGGTAATPDLVQWRRMLDKALSLDPKFAAARAQIAFNQMLTVWFGGSSETSLLYKAEEGARQALRDDPDCAVAHSTLAHVYLMVGRKELVPLETQKALQTNPQDPAPHLCVALYHLANGEYQQATKKLNEIIRQWPTFSPTQSFLGEALREQGDTSGTMRAMERILEVAPDNPWGHWQTARTYMDLGDVPKARQSMERVAAVYRSNYFGRIHWALLLALERKKADALREMDEQTLTYAGSSYLGPLQPAEIYAVLGETDKALDWLDRAVRWGDEREDWLRRDPHLAGIRNHPRFQQMLDSIAYRRKQRPQTGAANR